jgi:hypothetical protein
MQGLEESKDIHYILERIGEDSRATLKELILTTLSTTSNFLREVVAQVYQAEEEHKVI